MVITSLPRMRSACASCLLRVLLILVRRRRLILLLLNLLLLNLLLLWLLLLLSAVPLLDEIDHTRDTIGEKRSRTEWET